MGLYSVAQAGQHGQKMVKDEGECAAQSRCCNRECLNEALDLLLP